MKKIFGYRKFHARVNPAPDLPSFEFLRNMFGKDELTLTYTFTVRLDLLREPRIYPTVRQMAIKDFVAALDKAHEEAQ